MAKVTSSDGANWAADDTFIYAIDDRTSLSSG
jgi:hypothetical protein